MLYVYCLEHLAMKTYKIFTSTDRMSVESHFEAYHLLREFEANGQACLVPGRTRQPEQFLDAADALYLSMFRTWPAQ